MRKINLPPTDAQLAAEEVLEIAQRVRAIQDNEEQDRLEPLVKAREPEALLAASAFRSSQPAEPPPEPKRRKPRAPAELKLVESETLQERELTDKQEKAFRLMDLAYRRFARDFRRKPKEARETLMLDLIHDSAIYVMAGIWKSGDPIDAINKLTGVVRSTQDESQQNEDLDRQFEELANELRGDR